MPEAPRVAFVVDGPLDQPTGGYLYDALVIEGLRERGYLVDLVNLRTDGLAAVLLENKRVSSLFRQDKPRYDVVIIDELCHPRVVFAAMVARFFATPRAPVLVTLLHHLAASEREGFAARSRLCVERALLLSSTRVVVTSETTRRVALRASVPSSRIVVARPGRDRLGQLVRPRFARVSGPVRLLFLGSLTERKDPLLLLDAFGFVADKATLTLVGPLDRDPLYAARVLASASRYGERVTITGAVHDDALADLFRSHDVFVLPSRYEGFGIAIAEAASFGLAIVACRVGAIPEVVGDGAAALLVPPRDALALASALSSLVDDPERLARQQAAASERALQLPTWANTKTTFADAIDDVRADLDRGLPRI